MSTGKAPHRPILSHTLTTVKTRLCSPISHPRLPLSTPRHTLHHTLHYTLHITHTHHTTLHTHAPECRQVAAAHCTRELKVGCEGLAHAWCTELNTLRDLTQQQAHLCVCVWGGQAGAAVRAVRAVREQQQHMAGQQHTSQCMFSSSTAGKPPPPQQQHQGHSQRVIHSGLAGSCPPLPSHTLTRMSHLLHDTLKPGAHSGALRDAYRQTHRHRHTDKVKVRERRKEGGVSCMHT